jgi:hypothetical protein
MRIFAVLTFAAAFALCAQTPPDASILHIQAQLSSKLQLNKTKVGDKLTAQTVTAVTLPNGTAIPIGSMLLGQVLKLDADSVTVSFDQVNVASRKIPLNITLVGAAMMDGKNQMSQANSSAKVDSPSPEDHPSNVSTHSGSVIGMPGVTLSIDDGPPYASQFKLTTKDLRLPKGVQLMFSVR